MSKFDKRLEQLEDSNNSSSERDALIEQVINTYQFWQPDISRLEATAIADNYLSRGIAFLSWEVLFCRDEIQ